MLYSFKISLSRKSFYFSKCLYFYNGEISGFLIELLKMFNYYLFNL